jgi:TolA-binding protein
MNPNLPKDPSATADDAGDTAERDLIAQLEEMGRGLDAAGPAQFLGAHKQRALVDSAFNLARNSTGTLTAGTKPFHSAPTFAHRASAPRWIRRGGVALVFFAASAAAGLAGHRIWLAADQASPQTPLTPPAPRAVQHRERPSSAATELAANEPVAQEGVALPGSTEIAGHTNNPTTAAATEPSQDLLKEANALRRQGDLTGAKRLYLQVVKEQQGSMAAYVAQVAVAELELKQDPSTALRNYLAAQAQSPTGSLELEILQGIAQSYRALGNPQEEHKILAQIRDRYPNSIAARNAGERLGISSPQQQ